jgi:protein-disulfide isomerase
MHFRARHLAAALLVCAAALLAQEWQTVTNLPAVDFTGLTAPKTATALKVLREYDCACGCGMKVAECRVKDPGCAWSKNLAATIVGAFKAGKTAAAATEMARTSKYGSAPPPQKLLDDPITIATAGSPVVGPANASVTLIEFSDFQCPYCWKAAAQLRDVLKAFPNDVKLVFREYPLETHSQAALAAAAAIAAHKQGKFWQLHDLMFANRQDLSKPAIEKLAQQVGLDMKRFMVDWPAKDTVATVMRDMADGEKAGVDGTPTVFVNGKHYHGSLELEPMKNVIQAELKTAKK